MAYNFITAQEAAEMIHNGATIGLSGFTAPGTPKAITEALAAKAVREHEAGRPFKVNMFTGASTSDHVDGVLSRANAYNMRAPYQNVPDLRKRINSHDCHYNDRHLSEMAQEVRYGTYGDIDFAIIEVADITDSGELILGCGIGNVPTYAAKAKKIFIELNAKLPKALLGMHDVYLPLDPPYRREIPIYAANDQMAYGAMLGLQSAGKRVPEDVSVVGVDDSLGDIVPDRRLTTVRFDNKRVGMWAVDKIAGAEGAAPGVEHMLFPGVLVEGDTVRDVR